VHTRLSLAPLVAAASLATCSPTAATRVQDHGVLEGTVTFIGVPCGPGVERRVPPCDGPYPDYEVIVYKADGEAVAGRTRSDASARYSISLTGNTDYIVYVPAGIREQKKLSVRVPAGGRITLDLQIDTGVR
jgi:hypothetical protein